MGDWKHHENFTLNGTSNKTEETKGDKKEDDPNIVIHTKPLDELNDTMPKIVGMPGKGKDKGKKKDEKKEEKKEEDKKEEKKEEKKKEKKRGEKRREKRREKRGEKRGEKSR